MFVSVYLFLVFVGGAVSLSRRLDVHEHLRIEKKKTKKRNCQRSTTKWKWKKREREVVPNEAQNRKILKQCVRSSVWRLVLCVRSTRLFLCGYACVYGRWMAVWSMTLVSGTFELLFSVDWFNAFPLCVNYIVADAYCRVQTYKYTKCMAIGIYSSNSSSSVWCCSCSWLDHHPRNGLTLCWCFPYTTRHTVLASLLFFHNSYFFFFSPALGLIMS